MIDVKNLRKSYGDLEVLRGVSLSIAPAELVAIVGPSGAGKSTLLQIVGSLDRPDSGSVTIGGQNIFSLGDKALAHFRNRNIGFVFQFHSLLPEFSLVENVAMPAVIGGDRRTDATRRAMELIDYLGLKDRAGHRPAQLSGGERQRAAVARALINDPKVILADEPSGSLDTANRRELHDLFFRLRKERSQTFVIVTHDDTLAAEADRTIHLRDGLID